MLGVFRLESQMLPGNGKFEKTGIGSDREAKESINTAFNFLKANGNRISGAISTITKDYFINYCRIFIVICNKFGCICGEKIRSCKAE